MALRRPILLAWSSAFIGSETQAQELPWITSRGALTIGRIDKAPTREWESWREGGSQRMRKRCPHSNLRYAGTWALRVVDDASDDCGQIGGGWSLIIKASVPTS
jgi:hypothetical protein